jgi:hypothetical protein
MAHTIQERRKLLARVNHVLSNTGKVDSREARAAEDLVEILHRYIK